MRSLDPEASVLSAEKPSCHPPYSRYGLNRCLLSQSGGHLGCRSQTSLPYQVPSKMSSRHSGRTVVYAGG